MPPRNSPPPTLSLDQQYQAQPQDVEGIVTQLPTYSASPWWGRPIERLLGLSQDAPSFLAAALLAY